MPNKPLLIVSDASNDSVLTAIRAGFAVRLTYTPDFEVIEDKAIAGGFIAVIDGRVYDASFASRLRELSDQLSRDSEGENLLDFMALGAELRAKVDASSIEPRTYADGADAGKILTFDGISADLRERVGNVESAPRVYDYGEVVSSADGIAHVTGLSGVRYGELLDFGNGAIGVTMDVVEDKTGVAVIDGEVSTASVARMTGRIAEVAVGYELLGRVVDPLGRPLDGDPLPVHKMRPLESAAPSIMHRANVDTPLETGILAIDSMIPIGRGQRELIIGDRQTGKTSIALQTILSQKGRGVLCVYCAIGQKASSVASVVKTLSDADALEYTVVVTANASSSAAMQYLAPYAACAIAEEFMYSGRDALVIYDDLSKHAAAYRALSLLLRRPSGREAYPGDVFYLHSRLLERAARMSEELGGGSLTALPIVETMAGDISAYIPTNVISITDGQIYLESDLFSAGQRPAVNVGLSVSRVGRAAQSKAMRDVSGALRLDVAQYNEMAVFAQFGADVDSATANMLRSGEAVMELLRQPETQLYTLADQVALLLAKTIGLFANMPRRDVREASALLLQRLHDVAGGVMRNIQITGKLEPTDREIITHEIEAFAFYKTITTPPEPERKGAVKDTDYVKR